MVVIQTRVSGRHSLKIQKVSVSLRGRHLVVCMAKDRIGAFKQELKFGGTCFHHPELDIFPKTERPFR